MAHRAKINDCENFNKKDVCEVSNMMNNYGLRCKMFAKNKPLTNADRIRGYTDEELAEFLCGGCCREGEAFHCSDVGCKKCWLDWLKQEVKD